MKKVISLLTVAVLSLFAGNANGQALGPGSSATAQACTSANIGTITWVFTTTYTCGKYATGDFWVTNTGGSTVSIKSISPAYAVVAADGSHRNGSMLNPTPNSGGFTQGFDSRSVGQSTGGNAYSDAVNVGITMPLVITEGLSLMSSESYDVRPQTGHQPYIKQIQVLTVVATQPAVGDFRPPYVGSNKTPLGNVSAIDYAKLGTLAMPSSFTTRYPTAVLDTIAVEPAIELQLGVKGRYLHAGDNYSPKIGPVTDYGYGQNIGMAYSVLITAINGNYSNAQKQMWVYRAIQIGIDMYGASQNAAGVPSHGIIWLAGGAHNPGKHWSFLFAGHMLNNATIKAWGNVGLHRITNEGNQYFRVSQNDINNQNHVGANTSQCPSPGGVANYPQSSLGMAEQGADHYTSNNQDDYRLYGSCYRHQVGTATVMTVLAMQWMGLKSSWNQDEIFEYFELRHMPWSIPNVNATNHVFTWQVDLWNLYHNVTAPDGVPGGGGGPNTNPTISLVSTPNLETTSATATGTVNVADSDGTISSVTWARTYPTAASGSCSVVAGVATCSGMSLVGKANNAFTFTATDNANGTATVDWNVLRRTCPTTPNDDYDVDGSWAFSLGPCWLAITSNVISTSGGSAIASAALTRHFSLWNTTWTGLPASYSVQVTSRSQVVGTSSFLLFGCFGSQVGSLYQGYSMSMEGGGSVIARYNVVNGVVVRTGLNTLTQPTDGGWITGETGRLDCEIVGSDPVLKAYDQNGVQIGSTVTDNSVSKITTGMPFVGGWGSAAWDLFVATAITGSPAADTTPPTTTLTFPVSNPTNTNDLTYNLLTGTAADGTAVSTITCLNVTTNTACTMGGTLTSWTVPTVTLMADVANTIRITACDAALNCSAPLDIIINHATSAPTIVAFISFPGAARLEPYLFKGDQINLRGTCTGGTTDHVEIWVNGIVVGGSDTPISSSYVTGTTNWETIKPLAVGISPTNIVSVASRCVEADSDYVETTINVISIRPPSRGR